MFGNRQRLTELGLRMDELEEHQRTLATRTAAAVDARLDELRRVVGEDPQRRLALVVEAVSADLEGQLRRALDDLEALRRAVGEMAALRTQADAMARGEAGRAPRMRCSLGHIYQAAWTGYVCLYFDGGHTDRVDLVVGDESPPDNVVCRLNTRNDINSYAGAVVRKGEYWMARTASEGESGVRCVFTPFL